MSSASEDLKVERQPLPVRTMSVVYGMPTPGPCIWYTFTHTI